MNLGQLFFYGIILLAILFTALTFYNTIITKKWRNKVINETECWKWGIFYFNPIDKRIFLPKRTGLGLTLNFANPVSIVVICGIIALVIISLVYSNKK